MSNKQVAEQAFDRVEQNLRDLSRWMYENPELGYEEFEASARKYDGDLDTVIANWTAEGLDS